MAKKKKPASNPARGFATTSVASKTKSAADTPQSDSPTSSTPANGKSKESKTITPSSETHQTAVTVGVPEKELHELSPEELERRLEEADLQGLIEKLGPKAQREANRVVTKLQTDNRLSKTTSEIPRLSTFLLPDVLEQALSYASEEVNSGRLYTIAEGLLDSRRLPEDDLISKLWTLQLSLTSLGFSEEHVAAVGQHLLRHTPNLEQQTSYVWGLEEALDWLILHLSEDLLPKFDKANGKAIEKRSDDMSCSELALSINDADEDQNSSRDLPERSASKPNDQKPEASASVPEEEVSVSDVDSDAEPEELLRVYLDTKLKFHEQEPSVKTKAKSRGSKNVNPRMPLTNLAKKLEQKLQKIESDPLFDTDNAMMVWEGRRIEWERERAEKARLTKGHQNSTTTPLQEGTPEIRPLDAGEGEKNGDEDCHEDLLGGVFGMDDANTSNQDETAAADTPGLAIRVFKTSKGLSPRRILEDACRSRDASVRVTIKEISQTTFSYRHQVSIVWSKPQPLVTLPDIPAVSFTSKPQTFTAAMASIACPTKDQSEGYIATLALFCILVHSQKDENVYFRLPATWRDLYEEFTQMLRSKRDASDREFVRGLRDSIRAHNKQYDDENSDFVHKESFANKQKIKSDTSASRSNGDRSTIASPDALKELHDRITSSDAFQKMQPGRSNLPMAQFRSKVTQLVEDNQVVILSGETGCGKSTQMPAYILESELKAGRHVKIFCSEPRRISAISLAHRVAQELGDTSAQLTSSRSIVGYSIRLENKTGPNTRLAYVTTGVLLRMLESPEKFQDVTHVIVDEVHERSIDTDFLLILLRKLIFEKGSKIKVVLMSATLEADKFSAYFNRAPTIAVPGRTFPVTTHYLEDALEVIPRPSQETSDPSLAENNDSDDGQDNSGLQATELKDLRDRGYSAKTCGYIKKLNPYQIDYSLIKSLLEVLSSDVTWEQYSRAILIFLPGFNEIRRMNDIIRDSSLGNTYEIHQLHSSVSSADQQAAFKPPPKHLRGKIVLATNIAETGVTIPDVTCVIDTGKHKEMRFDERRQVSKLLESFISRANAKQRRGRAGRVQEGVCFHLFTKVRHDQSLAEQQTPEIKRLSLQNLVIRIKLCNLGSVKETLADALDAPLEKNIQRAIYALVEVGALTPQEDVTALGRQLSKLSVDPYLGKLLLHGALYGCLDTMLTIAAVLTYRSPFIDPLLRRDDVLRAYQAFQLGHSDLMTLHNAYASWRRVLSSSNMNDKAFCHKNCMSAQHLGTIEELKASLLMQMADAGLVSMDSDTYRQVGQVRDSMRGKQKTIALPYPGALSESNDGNEALVQAATAASFYPKLLVQEGNGWRNVASNAAIRLVPTSIVKMQDSGWQNRTHYLSYHSIMSTTSGGGGSTNLRASSLTPVDTAPLLLMLDTRITFHPTSRVLSVDGGRIRLFVRDGLLEVSGGWKAFVALKFLKRRIDEIIHLKWKNPLADPPPRLARWWDLWIRVVQSWSATN